MRKYLLPFIVPVALCAAWEVTARWGWVPSSLLAPPSEVLLRLFELSLNGSLLRHTSASLERLITGFAVGSLLGIATGLICGLSKLFQRLLNPTIQYLAPIPPIVWVPILIAIFGIGDVSKIALLAIACFFIVYLHTYEGVRHVDLRLIEVTDALNKTYYERLIHLFIPATLPHVFLGLRLALGLCWVLLIAAEVIASSEGLGWLVWDARTFSRVDDMYSAIIAIGFLGKVSDIFLLYVSRRLMPWHVLFEGR